MRTPAIAATPSRIQRSVIEVQIIITIDKKKFRWCGYSVKMLELTRDSIRRKCIIVA